LVGKTMEVNAPVVTGIEDLLEYPFRQINQVISYFKIAAEFTKNRWLGEI
jgi:hypothetical protein